MDHSEVKHLPKIDYTPAELDEASKLLLKAADLIEKGGLAKHALCDGAAYCIGGAIFAAAGWAPKCRDGSEGAPTSIVIDPRVMEASERVNDAIGGSFVNWNNERERVADEVVSKLRAVALGL